VFNSIPTAQLNLKRCPVGIYLTTFSWNVAQISTLVETVIQGLVEDCWFYCRELGGTQ
jgi:hypothetical protein